MRERRIPRVLAAMFLGVLLGMYRHFRQMQWLARGREAFLGEQNHYFDQITKTHSTGVTVVAGIILAVVAAGLYEAAVLGFRTFIPAMEVEE